LGAQSPHISSFFVSKARRILRLFNCLNIPIALINADFGEQKAQSCENACLTPIGGMVRYGVWQHRSNLL